MKREQINYEKVVEMVVFCPNFKEKEQILKRFIKKLIEIEKLEQITDELKKVEKDYEINCKLHE